MSGRGADGIRHAVRRVHLWMGLTLGLLLSVAGITGAILVYYVEIDRMLNPAVASASGPPDHDRAMATLRAAFPDKAGPWRIELDGRDGAIPVRYYDPPERSGRAFAPMLAWLSPDGEQVLRRSYWGETAMTWIYDLHYRLLLERPGGTIMGYAGLFMLVLLASGIWAWWPRDGRFAKAFAFRRHAPPVRSLRDWHKLAGVSASLVLLVIVGTGVMLELPKESDAVLEATLGPVDRLPEIVADPFETADIGPVAAVAAARAHLPDALPAWIETPPRVGGFYRVRVQVPGDPSRRFPHSYVWIDRSNGAVLGVADARRASASTVVTNWLHPLHDGSFGGSATRALLLLSGLVPSMLFVTGVSRWRIRKAARVQSGRR